MHVLSQRFWRGVFLFMRESCHMHFVRMCNTLQHTATHWNTLYAATYCNTHALCSHGSHVTQTEFGRQTNMLSLHLDEIDFVYWMSHNAHERIHSGSWQKQGFEHTELPAKLLNYFLQSNKSNINQSHVPTNPCDDLQNWCIFMWPCVYTPSVFTLFLGVLKLRIKLRSSLVSFFLPCIHSQYVGIYT